MIELYFGIKLIYGAIIIGLIILFCLILPIKYSISSFKEDRIRKYLESIGYRRELISTASFGTNHTYGYKRFKDNGKSDIIYDYELRGMSLKQVKQKYI